VKDFIYITLLILLGSYISINYYSSVENASEHVIYDHYSYVDEINRMQMRKLDPGVDPIENIKNTNGEYGRRSPEFKGMSAVAGISDDLRPVGALTDKQPSLPGSVISIQARTLYFKDGVYTCNSNFLANYIVWIKGSPVLSSFAPCATRSTEVYWHEKLKPTDIKIEYVNDRWNPKESNDLLIKDILLDDVPVNKKSTNASWTLNECKDYASLEEPLGEVIMHCNGTLQLKDDPLIVMK
jgi:hypothetical protein